MKLLCVDCHNWNKDLIEEKIDILVNDILKNKYEIIAIEGACQKHTSNTLCSNIKEDNLAVCIIKKLQLNGVRGYNFIWNKLSTPNDTYEEGVAIITKLNIENHVDEFFNISNTSFNALLADINFNDNIEKIEFKLF